MTTKISDHTKRAQLKDEISIAEFWAQNYADRVDDIQSRIRILDNQLSAARMNNHKYGQQLIRARKLLDEMSGR